MSEKRVCYFFVGFMAISLFMIVVPSVAFAGPGGIIAREFANTWIGKAVAAVFVIVFLPLFLYITFKESIAKNKTKKDLVALARVNGDFRWTVLNERAHTIVTQVYSAWRKSDAEKAMAWMTDWYWQNQKSTVLDEWESSGLKNHCNLKKVKHIQPLYVEYCEQEPGDGEGSRIILTVEVNLQDYLINEQTEKIVEGDKKYKNFESIWTLLYEGNQWKLSLIEESSMSITYAQMKNDLEEAQGYIKTGFKYKKSMQE